MTGCITRPVHDEWTLLLTIRSVLMNWTRQFVSSRIFWIRCPVVKQKVEYNLYSFGKLMTIRKRAMHQRYVLPTRKRSLYYAFNSWCSFIYIANNTEIWKNGSGPALPITRPTNLFSTSIRIWGEIENEVTRSMLKKRCMLMYSAYEHFFTERIVIKICWRRWSALPCSVEQLPRHPSHQILTWWSLLLQNHK